jgi:hypothetical protein
LFLRYAERHDNVQGSGGIPLSVLNFGKRWMRVVVSFRFRPLCPRGRSAWYPLDRRLGGPVWTSMQRQQSHCLPGNEAQSFCPWAVTLLTSLARLSRGTVIRVTDGAQANVQKWLLTSDLYNVTLIATKTMDNHHNSGTNICLKISADLSLRSWTYSRPAQPFI